MQQQPPKPRLALTAGFRALRHRNYRLFISGQVVSLTGLWIHSTALNWLVYNVLTDSSLELGLVNFASQIPVLLLALVGGGVADYANRYKLIVTTQILFMLHAIVMTVLTLWHRPDGLPVITYSLTLLLSVVFGVIQAFDLPARQAFLLQMVPKEDLQNAVALNSLTFNAARIIGPALAGWLVAYISLRDKNHVALGEGACFLLNSLTYIAVIVSLLRMDVPKDSGKPKEPPSFNYLMQGLLYVYAKRHLRALFAHLAIMAFFGITYLMIIPVFAKDILKGDASILGTLMASVGMGALGGGVIMAMRTSVRGLGHLMVVSTGAFSLFVLLFAFSNSVITGSILIGIAGFCMVMTMIASQTLAQMLVVEDMRGRVMSIYSMISIGMLPFGSLLSGALADQLNVRWAFAINASVCLATTAYFAIRLPSLRHAAHASTEYKLAISAEVAALARNSENPPQ